MSVEATGIDRLRRILLGHAAPALPIAETLFTSHTAHSLPIVETPLTCDSAVAPVVRGVMLQPLLEHHENPDHFSIVARVRDEAFVHQ